MCLPVFSVFVHLKRDGAWSDVNAKVRPETWGTFFPHHQTALRQTLKPRLTVMGGKKALHSEVQRNRGKFKRIAYRIPILELGTGGAAAITTRSLFKSFQKIRFFLFFCNVLYFSLYEDIVFIPMLYGPVEVVYIFNLGNRCFREFIA